MVLSPCIFEIHSFNKDEWSTYYMLGIVLGDTDKNIYSYGAYILVKSLFSLCV